MINENQTQDIIGSTAYSEDGDKLGKVGQLFLDDANGRPEFVTVNTGLFGTSESFVPVQDATFADGRLTVPFSKNKVKDAPNVDLSDEGHLDQDVEDRLYTYYGVSGVGTTRTTDEHAGTTGTTTGTGTRTGTGTGTGDVAPAGHDVSGPDTDDAMTRSEEHVEVGTASREAGRARLRKYVTTETETRTVPVKKERAVLESEPITEGNVDRAVDGPSISEEEHEVVLHEEKPVVEKTAEPVERVRLGTESTVDEETVTEDVRKENVDVDGDVDRDVDRRR